MINPNSPVNKLKTGLRERWHGPDFPGGEPRLQLVPVLKDVGIFILFPAVCVLIANANGKPSSSRKSPSAPRRLVAGEKSELKPQILNFEVGGSPQRASLGARRAPGTLVRVKLLNVAETLSETPIHAQILDYSLGSEYYGGILLGDGSGDSNFSRMNINFRFAKRRNDPANAAYISARALSLDGTLGLEAGKREGLFARGALGGAAVSGASLNRPSGGPVDLQTMILQALAQGFSSELSGEATTLRNNADVLTLEPGREFFAELKDFFPSGGK